VVALSPVSSTGRRPSSTSSRIACAGGRLDGVGDDEDRDGVAVPSGRDRGLAAALGRVLGGLELGRQVHRPVREQRRPAGDDRVSFHDALDAEPRARVERLRRGERAGLGCGGARDRLRDGVLGRVLERSDQPQGLRPLEAVGYHHVDKAHVAARDRAGLVEHDRVDRARRLEHLGALDQDTELSATASSDQQRRRRGQAECARAGDDQDRDRGRERELHARAAADPEPERPYGKRDDNRDEDTRDAVGQPLNLGLAGLRLRDEPGDLGKRGVGADAGRADDHAPARVDACAGDVVAGALLDRDRLAGQQ
jgi:hypothetical protein